MDKPVVKKRDPWLDNIRGVLMVLVVVNHFLASFTSYGAVGVIYRFCNSFHMPAFMIISGFLAKRKIDERDYKGILLRLGLPYVVAQLLFYVYCCFLPHGMKMLIFPTVTTLDFLVPNYHLWFLFAVLAYYLFTAMFASRYENKKVVFIITIICAVLSGFGLEVNFMRLNKIIAFYPYFYLGYMMQKETLLKLKEKKYRVMGAVALVVWFAIVLVFRHHLYIGLGSMATSYAHYPKAFRGLYPPVMRCVILFAGTIVSLGFIAFVTSKDTPFAKLGRNSMYIYILHGYIVFLFRGLNKDYHFFNMINTYPKLAIFALFAVALTFVLGTDFIKKKFKWFIEPEL